jgi:cytochrome c oxidase cbb3-type subunit IV
MKYQTYLERIEGVEIYPIISLVLFVSFFIAVTIMILRMSSKEIAHIERLPLEDQ